MLTVKTQISIEDIANSLSDNDAFDVIVAMYEGQHDRDFKKRIAKYVVREMIYAEKTLDDGDFREWLREISL